MSNFIPFDIRCFNKLKERFEYVFEEKLIDEICQYGISRSFQQDSIIIDIGDDITHMPLVINGCVKVMTEDDEGLELLLYYLELGDTCAVTLNCCTKKTKSNVRAITEVDSDMLFIPVEKMDEWIVKYKSWRTFVFDSYNVRMHEMLEAIDNVVFHSMEDRIKKYISDKSIVNKSSNLQISHFDIAQDLHSSRVVVSRIMKKLELEGFIKQGRGSVEILK